MSISSLIELVILHLPASDQDLTEMYFALIAIVALFQLVITTNGSPSLPQLKLPTNISSHLLNATIFEPPAPPPGYRADVGIYKAARLNPKGYMLGVISMIQQLAERPWGSFVQREGKLTTFGVGVIVHPLGENRLRVGDAILALHAAAARAVEEDLFYQTWVNVSIFDAQIGELGVILPSRAPTQTELSEVFGTNNVTAGNRMERGVIELGQFKISWEDSPRKLPSKDMFTAVVEALTILAPYRENTDVSGDHCQHLSAISPLSFKGQVVINVQFDRNAPSCKLASVVLQQIFSRVYVDRNVWTELDFEILFNDQQLGSGFVTWLPLPFSAHGTAQS